MRIRELQQRAFGRFTDHELKFGFDNDPMPGLHVVFGLNEAGKTTTLNAIRYGLYGIPNLRNDPRTYDFLHRKPDLRIGMVLEANSGEVIRFTRRKKTGDTCFDFDDAMPEATTQDALDALLRGVDRDLFTRKYGIDYQILREGGEGLANEGESVGESLFAATTGIVGIHTTLKTLAAQTGALLKDTGRSGSIHDATKRFDDADSAVRKAIRAGRQWHPKQADLERATRELRALQDSITKSSSALEQVKAINEAVPTVIERVVRAEEVAALGPVIENWSAEREQQRTELRGTISQAARQIDEVTLELKAREAHEQELLAQADERLDQIAERVRRLKERIAEYVAARASATQLQAAQMEAATKVTGACHQVRADSDGTQSADLIPTLAVKSHARGLLSEYSQVQRDVSAAEQSWEQAENALEAFKARNEPLPASVENVSFLEVILGSVEKVDTARLAQLEQAASSKSQQLKARVAAFPRSSHDLEALLDLAAPLEATIEDFDHRMREADTKATQAREALANARKQMGDQVAKIHHLAKTQPVPSAEELAYSRNTRDEIWQQIRAAWLDKPASHNVESIAAGTEAAVAQAFEGAIGEADEHADRRTAAGAIIGQITAAEALRNALTEDILQRQIGLDLFQRELDEVRNRWRELWSSVRVDVGTVPEMRAWLSELGDVRRAASELSSERDEAESLRERVERARRDLYNGLATVEAEPPAEDISVEVLEARARQLITSANTARQAARDREVARNGLEVTLETAKKTMNRTNDDLEAWTGEWSKAAIAIGLTAEASADAGEGALEAIETLEAALGGLELATRACAQNELTVRSFESDATSLLDAVGGELADALQDKPAEQIVRDLSARADSSQNAKTGLDALRPVIKTLKQNQINRKRSATEAANTLAQLATEAGLNAAEDLDSAAKHWNRCESLLAQIRDQDSEIIKVTKMPPLDVIAYLEETPVGQLPNRISEICGRLDDLGNERQAKEADIQELHDQIAQLKVDVQLERALADKADARADLERLAIQYTRLKLEYEILAGYLRDKAASHIGPALKRAGELFQQLTCGAYSGVTQDVNDDDKPVLKVLPRAGSSMDRIGLSRGTSDQLYLALRLASVYQQLDQPGQEPLPFIVDDILPTFDDERSAATMHVLSELALRTQVIFFSHHQHLVDLARAEVPENVLRVTHPALS